MRRCIGSHILAKSHITIPPRDTGDEVTSCDYHIKARVRITRCRLRTRRRDVTEISGAYRPAGMHDAPVRNSANSPKHVRLGHH